MPRNNNNTLNTTELMTGKDGRLYIAINNVNTFLAEVNQFNVVMNVNTTEYQAVGALLVGTVPTGVTFDLTFTEAVIRDDVLLRPILDAIKNGYVPTFNFQGVVAKPDGNGEMETITFNNAMPNGSIGIQKLVPGEVVTREMSFRLNSIPQMVYAMATHNTYS